MQVEHYRPKKAVEEDTSHKGYYWLAIEWTNLVYACQKCNGKSGKGTKFPIIKQRVYQENRDINGGIIYTDFDANSACLQNEQPLLLHPEIDEPKEHLTFRNNGKLIGITQRGRETIKICKLNRDLLIKSRKDIVDDVIVRIQKVIVRYSKISKLVSFEISISIFKEDLKIEIFDEIYKEWDDSLNYTLVRNSIKEDFNLRVIQRVAPKIRQIISFAHQDYLNGNL